jgi:tRNA uridine 5-carbamoylmethylation protein Kti12
MKHILYFKVFENKNNGLYYHGSYDMLDNGTILKPHDESYTKKYDNSYLEKIMEKYRPVDKLSRYDSVFLVDDMDSLDDAGASTDFIYSVEPIGNVEKSDLAWYTEVQMVDEDDTELMKEYVENYWNGVPFTDSSSSVFEYRVPAAKIIELVEEN